MIMAGVSGAAIADAAAVGSMMIPAMVKKGYRPGFAGAVNAAAATIGPVIPPSVGFLIYASVVVVSPGGPTVTPEKLFLAGAVPGLLMGLYMLVACALIARHRGLPRGERTSFRGLLRAARDASWALVMPVIVLGGILTGIVTPTEAGGLAVLFGLVAGMLVYREIRLRDLPGILARTARQTAAIMAVIACANLFGFLMTSHDTAETLMSAFTGVTRSPHVFLLIVCAVSIVLGAFMEGGSIMIILTPLLCPVLESYGINLVQFGVIFQLTIMIGLLTPPVGMLLFVITGVSRVSMHEILKELWPFFIVLLLILLTLVFVPQVSLWLPALRYPGG
jgi:C4-dicarboxylate transporter DctM subunit